MRVYLILDDNQDNIIPIEWIKNLPMSRSNHTSYYLDTIKPLGDTQSLLNITLKCNNYKYLRDRYNTSWKKGLSVVTINDDDKLIYVNYYRSFINEVTTTVESEMVDVEIRADYHEVHYDDNEELKALFKSWERELKLNQLGI
jgi:hypothetical protein